MGNGPNRNRSRMGGGRGARVIGDEACEAFAAYGNACHALACLAFRTAFDLREAALLEPEPRRQADGLRRAIRMLDDARWFAAFPHGGDVDAVDAWREPRRRRTNIAASAAVLTQQRDELLAELFNEELRDSA